MNFGSKIYELRKKKDATQEELAAELGVTAAAVSKWENGYSLPDILMLCQLADYFQVSTDELLGRIIPEKYAVIAAETEALGMKIAAIAKTYGIFVHGIYTDFEEAVQATYIDTKIGYILVSFKKLTPEVKFRRAPKHIHVIESQSSSDEEVLMGFEMMLKNLK